MKSDLIRLPLLSTTSINNGIEFPQIKFIGNNALGAFICDNNEAMVMIRRYDNLKYKNGGILTEECQSEIWGNTPNDIDNKDFCLSFKSSAVLASFIDSLNTLLKMQIEKEGDSQNE